MTSKPIEQYVKRFLANTHFHPSWKSTLQTSLAQMDPCYLAELLKQPNWLPGLPQLFNAFTLAKPKVNYILIGESPYPRPESANGYAFWDQHIDMLWSDNGLSKAVNRATSMRNFIKMLLVAQGLLARNKTTPNEIKAINKHNLIQTNQQLFDRLIKQGFLLLNASLVLHEGKVNLRQDAGQWQLFLQAILAELYTNPPTNKPIKLILFGKIAEAIRDLLPNTSNIKATDLLQYSLIAEHPYNLSFIQNQEVIDFFKPMELLIS